MGCVHFYCRGGFKAFSSTGGNREKVQSAMINMRLSGEIGVKEHVLAATTYFGSGLICFVSIFSVFPIVLHNFDS